MDTEKRSALEQIPADRGLVEKLYAHGKITQEGRDYALNFLYPPNQWGVWVSRLLLIVGAVLVLSGIVYFFAFNWEKVPPAMKLYSIQLGIISCLIGTCFYSLRRLSGQLLLLSASVLVGVFLAVFGQIYQTGADAWQLFMMWALLTLGWTLMSNFAAQWIFWLVITNICLVLWWIQAALPTKEMEYMIFTYMAVLNGAALALREYFVAKKKHEWLGGRWTREVLVGALLLITLIPIIFWIAVPGQATVSIMLSSIIGFIWHGTAYFLYRYKWPDMRSLTATVLSGFIIVISAGHKILYETLDHPITALLIGLMTLGVFACATAYLRKIAKKMAVAHGRRPIISEHIARFNTHMAGFNAYMTRFNAAKLLERLESRGLTANEEVADFVISHQQERIRPLYLGALADIGILLIASSSLIPFFIAADMISFSAGREKGLIIWGLLFVAGAVGLQEAIRLQRVAGHDNAVKHGFYMHSSIALIAMGKFFFAYGVGHMLESYWAFTWALLIITGMTYHTYRIEIDRFLSSFAVLSFILVTILLDTDVSASTRELLLNGFFLLQFAGTAILLMHGKIQRDYIPLCYAFVCSLCISVLTASFSAPSAIVDSTFINIVLTGGLIALFGWAAGGMEKLKSEPLVMASTGAVLLGLISAPGILLAIGLMVLGYAKHEEHLMIGGALLMPVFLFFYYYNLDISLMQKSGTLIGSGIVLLAGRMYMKHRRRDAGGAPCG